MSARGLVLLVVLALGACARPPVGHPTLDAVRDAAAEAQKQGSGGRPFTPLRGRP